MLNRNSLHLAHALPDLRELPGAFCLIPDHDEHWRTYGPFIAHPTPHAP